MFPEMYRIVKILYLRFYIATTQDAIPESTRCVESLSHISKKPALSRDLQIISRNAKVFVRVGRDYISRRRIEFQDDFGVDSLRGRNYDIT